MNDVDVSTVCSDTLGSWEPIGITPLAGTFDGKYHTISNLYINSNAYQYAGLFSNIATTGNVKNLILKEVNISNTYDVVSEFTCSGGIVARNYGIISNWKIVKIPFFYKRYTIR